MSLRQYEYALAVAEEGSVTAAAEVLHVAQPSVSQQIRGLERELGVELFARTPTGLVPTVVGRAFLREAEIAVRAARRAKATARVRTSACTKAAPSGTVPVADLAVASTPSSGFTVRPEKNRKQRRNASRGYRQRLWPCAGRPEIGRPAPSHSRIRTCRL
ncbi:MAG TPA: LysR family transcriptional regulator [Spirillospora sp.]|nr:LysR family transcriptional regulator [Spirillospora sp.]